MIHIADFAIASATLFFLVTGGSVASATEFMLLEINEKCKEVKADYKRPLFLLSSPPLHLSTCKIF